MSGEDVEEEVSSGDEKVDSETSYSKGSSLKAAKPTTKRMCTVEFNTQNSKATGIGELEMIKPKSVQEYADWVHKRKTADEWKTISKKFRKQVNLPKVDLNTVCRRSLVEQMVSVACLEM